MSQRDKPSAGRQLWLVGTGGPASHQLVADVAVHAPVYRTMAYAVPEALVGVVGPGARVRVPYGRGNRIVDGVCLRISPQPWDQTRPPLLEAGPGEPWLSPALVELGLWVGDYYACSPWQTFAALLPAALRAPGPKRVQFVRLTGVDPPRTPTARQAAVLAVLAGGEQERRALLARAGVTSATLETLRRRGVVTIITRCAPASDVPAAEDAPAPESGWRACPEDHFALTPGQQAALDQMRGATVAGDFHVFVLFGVPGSGKTEIYVRLMRAVIAAGRQAVLLIPEIALATQIVDRLARRFTRVAVLHSQLTAKRRRATLAAIAAGAVDVVIGTRTAVFAPCPRLGLIVVDEEQESSFKNLAAPFYHARDVAIKRGQLEGLPVVLGSATPALETWCNAQGRAHFSLVRLPDRVPGARLPEVRAVPTEAAFSGPRLLSAALRHELEQTLADGQQAILLHNRRGYALYLRCTQCGLLVNCQRCGGHMVYHRPGRELKCHRCGGRADVPRACLDSTCGGRLERTGLAIQRLEEELRVALPEARLLRLDSDTMRHRDDYAAALARFESGAADILLGTQMVAKGLDFPRVRLVGVIDADAALSLPDFRAAERVLQLVVQVVGRAGRREGTSLALVQTAEPTPRVIRHALCLDYEHFAAEELEQRRGLFYPPWAKMVRLLCLDGRPGRARAAAQRLSQTLGEVAQRVSADLRVEPAEACTVPRLREMLRYQVLVRGPRDGTVQKLLHEARAARVLRPNVTRFTIDVDPVDLL